MFDKQHSRRFRLRVDSGVSATWVDDTVENLHALPLDLNLAQRRRGVIDLPPGSTNSRAFIKVFHHTSRRHHKWRRRLPIQRLRPRYADHEGRALRHLAAAGVPVPKLLFYGEEWSLGIRRRGVVATELLTAPTLFEVLANECDRRWIEAYSRILARIHAAGLSHGDAHSRNFLVHNSRLVALDLENSRILTHKKRTSDLVTMVSSVLHATNREGSAVSALDSYLSAGGEIGQVSTAGLMKRGLVMADCAA